MGVELKSKSCLATSLRHRYQSAYLVTPGSLLSPHLSIALSISLSFFSVRPLVTSAVPTRSGQCMGWVSAGNHALLHAINMCGFDPECDRSMGEDIDIYDFIPYSSSPFSRLLEEKENMRAWNSFLAKSEEDQRSFLKSVQRSEDEEQEWQENGRGCLVQRMSKSGGKNRCQRVQQKDVQDKENVCDKLDDGSTTTMEEVPVQHPAFSPELSFARVDERIKRIFRKSRRVPIVSSLTHSPLFSSPSFFAFFYYTSHI